MIVAENPAWREGMGGSLGTGLRALIAAHPGITAALFVVCDQPLLSAEMLCGIVAAHEGTGRLNVLPRSEEKHHVSLSIRREDDRALQGSARIQSRSLPASS